MRTRLTRPLLHSTRPATLSRLATRRSGVAESPRPLPAQSCGDRRRTGVRPHFMAREGIPGNPAATRQSGRYAAPTAAQAPSGPSISRRSAVPPRRRGSARHLALRLRNRYASGAAGGGAQSRLGGDFPGPRRRPERPAAGGRAAADGRRYSAGRRSDHDSSSVPDRAATPGAGRRREWRAGKQRAMRDRGHPVRPARSR